jgi:hypothetical protein
MPIPKFITDRYVDGGGGLNNLDWSNIAKDLGVAGAVYGLINPNDSSGIAKFLGTGGRQQPIGYTGGIPNYMASRELAPNAFAQTYTTPTGEVAPRIPGSAGRRYFTDTAFTQSTDTPFMGITAEQIAAQNQAALDEQALFESILGGVETQRETTAAEQAAAQQAAAQQAAAATAAQQAAAAAAAATATTGTTTTDTATTATTDTTYTNFINQFAGRELTAADAAALAGSGYSLDALAKSFGVSAADLQNFVNYYTTGTGGTGGTTSDSGRPTAAELKQAVLDGTMDYSTAYRQLGIADAVNPFGFTEDEKMALGIHESQRTGQGYKYNPTTGSMDLYDYDTDAFVDTTGTDDIVNTLTLNAADGNTSTIDLTKGTTPLTTTGTATLADGPLAPTFDMVDASDGLSKKEQDIIYSVMNISGANIADVAEEFGASQLDVIEGLLRGGYETPEQIAATLNAVDPDIEFTEAQLIANLLEEGRTNPEEVAAYYKDHPVYGGITPEQVKAAFKDLGGTRQFAQGGNVNGYYLGGPTDGMADQIPATIDNMQPAALSDGEFVIPADVVSHLGNGNSDAGAQNLYGMMERVRRDRTGNPKQGKQIDPNKYLA